LEIWTYSWWLSLMPSKRWKKIKILLEWSELWLNFWKSLFRLKGSVIKNWHQSKEKKGWMLFYVSAGKPAVKVKTPWQFSSCWECFISEEAITLRINCKFFVISSFGKILVGNIKSLSSWRLKSFLSCYITKIII